jgi:hypothetical protein
MDPTNSGSSGAYVAMPDKGSVGVICHGNDFSVIISAATWTRSAGIGRMVVESLPRITSSRGYVEGYRSWSDSHDVKFDHKF